MRQHLLLSALSERQFSELMASARLIDLEPRQSLFQQGEAAERVFIVLAGRIKFFRISASGREIVISVLGRNDPVAEAAMFMSEQHYPANASAIEGSCLLAFNAQVYQRLLRQSVDSCFGVMAAMASRLQRSMAEIETLTQQDAAHRVARFILDLVDKGESGQVVVELPVSKQLIAARLAMQPETFSRVIAALKHKGLLQVNGGRLTIPSVAGLRQWAV
ncbi:Crp/Fnr family transcriptional regulator [Marinobacterium sp. D7]|uniref:Crp/Fnr family transcriptional regulator n=1 Tax=Marinobacterium ramblicola TaxID=2849041 RepID=UPI001C2CEC7A|nr:Crp/Fnr family transcriptional regulator [Marinobacterium ramblicola]